MMNKLRLYFFLKSANWKADIVSVCFEVNLFRDLNLIFELKLTGYGHERSSYLNEKWFVPST